MTEIGDGSNLNINYLPPEKYSYAYVAPVVGNSGNSGGNVRNYKFEQSKTIEVAHSGATPALEKVQVQVPVAAVSGGESSYQTFESSNQQQQSNTAKEQPYFIPNIKPNTFTTGILDLGPQHVEKDSFTNVYYSMGKLPTKKPDQNAALLNINENSEVHHVSQTQSRSKEETQKFLGEDNHLKVEDGESKVTYSENQHDAATQTVGGFPINNGGLPTSRLVVKIQPAVVGTSQITQKKTVATQTHTSSSNSQPFPSDSSLLNIGNSGYVSQLETKGVQNPVSSDSGKTNEKEAVSSAQTYYIHSPVLLGGVPQTVPLEKQSENGASGYHYTSSSYGGTSGAGSIPVLVGGIPQNFGISNQQNSDGSYGQKLSSSSSSSHFFSKSREPLLSNSDFYINQGDSNVLHSGSSAFEKTSGYHTNSQVEHSGSSTFDKLSTHETGSNGALCSACTGGHLIGSGQPAKNSYGFSTSFSSSSSNINGKKTENRAASVTVNDNGKVDTYNVKS